MPSCICGEFFSTVTYNIDRPEDDICPKCKSSATSTSYVSSHEWVAEDVSGLVLNSNNFTGNKGSSDG